MQGNSSAPPVVMTGTVVWWNPKKGFGFLRPSDGSEDVFCHYSALSGPPGRRNLNQDQRIEFERVVGPKGPMAHAVRICLPEGK